MYALVLAALLTVPFGASALPGAILDKRQSITTLSTAQINAFTPYTWYASAAYCTPATTIAWNCGANCQANPSFVPVASGGDGSDTQFWYVGYDPTLKQVIVGHQGTDTSSIVAELTDVDIIMGKLDSSLFPSVPSGVEVHEGFRNSQARSASSVLAAVKTAISAHSASTVVVVGHSLGGAIALLDAVYLHLQLSSSVTVKHISYGLPRVGNQAWATYVDGTGLSVTHVNNKEDPVPILPGMFLGFHHPAGEIHIQDSGAWDACPGEDNPSTLCTVGDVPNIFESNESDHDGPYNGVTMGC